MDMQVFSPKKSVTDLDSFETIFEGLYPEKMFTTWTALRYMLENDFGFFLKSEIPPVRHDMVCALYDSIELMGKYIKENEPKALKMYIGILMELDGLSINVKDVGIRYLDLNDFINFLKDQPYPILEFALSEQPLTLLEDIQTLQKNIASTSTFSFSLKRVLRDPDSIFLVARDTNQRMQAIIILTIIVVKGVKMCYINHFMCPRQRSFINATSLSHQIRAFAENRGATFLVIVPRGRTLLLQNLGFPLGKDIVVKQLDYGLFAYPPPAIKDIKSAINKHVDRLLCQIV
jgi:hypothetical protein